MPTGLRRRRVGVSFRSMHRMGEPQEIEPCDELVQLHRRFNRAMGTSDVETIGNLMSEDGCTLTIGSDAEEWWEGHDVLIGVVAAQFAQFGGFPWTEGAPVAWRLGDVAWYADRPTLQLDEQTSVTGRLTAVYALRAGHWQIVQLHLSFGSRNEEVIGFPLTTSLESLATFAEAERPDLSSVTARDGTITIVFTDIEASSEIAERLGDVRWLELLHWHDAVVIGEASRCGGTVVKSQGDGYMLAFESASHALDFASGVQSATKDGYLGQPVRVRIGINTGDAIHEREDFFGHAVIVASRVAAQALGGEVLATDLTAGLVAGAGFDFGPPRSASLKGLAGEYTVRPLLLATST
jgi:class 3 adenylate cyclase